MTLFSQKPKTSQTPQKSGEDFFGVQAKLSIGKSNDKYEVEADAMADTVVTNDKKNTPETFFSPSPLVQKKKENEEIQAKKDLSKQQRSISDATSNDTSGLENNLNSSKGSGTSLSGNTKKEMESGFETDFSTIKIHTDSNAVQMNKQLGSQAFANGNNVYFNEGKYNPNSQSGKHLLAHELTHTVQQGASQPAVQAKMMPAEPKTNPVDQPVVESKSVQKPETEAKPTTEAKPENNIVKTAPADNKNENAGAGATTPNKINPPVTVENAKPKEGQALPTQEANVAVQEDAAAPLPEEAQLVEGTKENANPDANKAPAEEIAPIDGAKPEEKPATDEEGAATKPNKEDNKAGKEGKKDKDGKAVDESAALAPKSPQEDPNFQKLAGRVGATAKGQQAHEKAEASASSAQSAALSPDNERQSKAQAGQVDEMVGAPPGEFSAEAFKAQLMARINSMQLPANQDEASDFKENNNIDEVSNAATQDVKKEKTAAVGPIEETANKEPNVAAIPEREIVPLPEAPIGDKPASVNPNQGMPPKRGDVEVNKPLEDNMAEVDQKMAENNITDEQLAKSNEPTFLEGLDSKAKAKENTEQAPQQLRNQEQGILGATKANANATGQLGLQNMHQDRDAALNQVVGQQQETGTKDTAERTRIAGEINLIYEKTKTDVDTLLTTLDTDVSTLFTAGAEAAKAKFENYVEQKMDAYKDDRYSGLRGKARWIRDKFKGLPDEVNQFFVDGRQVYIDHMDGVITQIAQLVASKLTEAKTRITTGKQEVQDFVLALPDNLQNIGKEAADAITTKFDELEENVKGKQDELIESLAQQYMEGLKAVDARIEEMKAANRGLIDMVLDALVGIIKTIISIVNMLTDLLSAALSAIGAIISDPIGFLSNLIDGVKLGFENFGSNILTHLTTGLVEWLTGSLGPMGIKIPADLFSLSGIFDLVAQILGVSWDYIRQKAIKMLGEPAVEALEKGFEVFVILKNEGIAGVWNYIKNEFGDLQVTIMDAIKDMVITKVIDAGIKWVLGLMNPAGAFIKAAMMIIDIVKFFMEKGSQIVELVHAFIDSIRAVASGSIGGVAKTIENALAKAIPVMIGFLASLLGITGLTEKVQKIIEKIRKRIDKAIDGLLLKAKKFFGFGKKKGKDSKGGKEINEKNKDGQKGNLSDNEVGENLSFIADGESHKLWIDSKGQGAEVMVASKRMSVRARLDKWRTKKKTLTDKKKEEAEKLLSSGETLYNSTREKAVKTDKEMEDAKKKMSDVEIKEAEKLDLITEKEQKQLMHVMIKLFEIFGDEDGVMTRFQSELQNIEPTAKLAIYDAIEKHSAELTEEKGVTSWKILVQKLKILTPATREIYAQPMSENHSYGMKLQNNNASNALTTALNDLKEEKKKEVVEKKSEFIKNRVPIIHGGQTAKAIEARASMTEQITDKNKQTKTTNSLTEYYSESLKGNMTEEHDKFKPKLVSVRVDKESITIEYHYEVEINGVTELRKFFSHMQLSQVNGSEGVEQITYGQNLVLKKPKTRGKTESVNQEEANAALAKSNEVEKEIGFDASHVLADLFLGSGYKEALNLVTTSADYNRKTMKTAENSIKRSLDAVEKRIQKENPSNYITFDMTVLARWNPLSDSETINGLKSANSAMTEEQITKLREMIANDKDPKLCQSVVYMVNDIKLNGKESIGSEGITEEIGPDTFLDKILIKKTNK